MDDSSRDKSMIIWTDSSGTERVTYEGDPPADDMPADVQHELARLAWAASLRQKGLVHGFMLPHTSAPQALTVRQVRALFPEWGRSPIYTDRFCQSLAAYAIRMGLRMEPGCFEVTSVVQYNPGPGGVGIAGSVICVITEDGLETLARRAGIVEGTHQVTQSGPLIATVRVHVPMPDGTLRPVDASASYDDWYDRPFDCAVPHGRHDGPGLSGTVGDGSRGHAHPHGANPRLQGGARRCPDGTLHPVRSGSDRDHRRCAAMRTQLAARIARLQGSAEP